MTLVSISTQLAADPTLLTEDRAASARLPIEAARRIASFWLFAEGSSSNATQAWFRNRSRVNLTASWTMLSSDPSRQGSFWTRFRVVLIMTTAVSSESRTAAIRPDGTAFPSTRASACSNSSSGLKT